MHLLKFHPEPSSPLLMRKVPAFGIMSGGAPSEDVGSSRSNEGNGPSDFDLFKSLEDLGNQMSEMAVETTREGEEAPDRSETSAH